MTEATDAFARDLQAIAAGHRPPEFFVVWPRDGVTWTVGPLLGERARITRGSTADHELGVYDEAWDYDDPRTALDALARFCLATLRGEAPAEPDRWVRHIPSGRRRPGGDPSLEEVRR